MLPQIPPASNERHADYASVCGAEESSEDQYQESGRRRPGIVIDSGIVPDVDAFSIDKTQKPSVHES
jgi:hypothetical protein